MDAAEDYLTQDTKLVRALLEMIPLGRLPSFLLLLLDRAEGSCPKGMTHPLYFQQVVSWVGEGNIFRVRGPELSSYREPSMEEVLADLGVTPHVVAHLIVQQDYVNATLLVVNITCMRAMQIARESGDSDLDLVSHLAHVAVWGGFKNWYEGKLKPDPRWNHARAEVSA